MANEKYVTIKVRCFTLFYIPRLVKVWVQQCGRCACLYACLPRRVVGIGYNGKGFYLV